MRRIKQPLTLREKFKKLPQAEVHEQIGKLLFNHLNFDEREKIKEQLLLALILEVNDLQSDRKRLINDNSEQFVEIEVLKQKLKKHSIRNPKSKIRNTK